MAALPPGVSDMPTQLPDSSVDKPDRDRTPPAIEPIQETHAIGMPPAPADGGSATPISTPPKLRDDPPTRNSSQSVTPAPEGTGAPESSSHPVVPGYEIH